MAVRNVKILKGVLYADVDVGTQDNGNRVTLSFKLTASDPALVEALKPVNDLLEERAQNYLGQAATSKIVKGRVAEAVDEERRRLQKLADDRLRAAAVKIRNLWPSDAVSRDKLAKVADDLDKMAASA